MSNQQLPLPPIRASRDRHPVRALRRLPLVAMAAWFCSAAGMLAGEADVRVTPLQAGHVAEIHVGGPADQVELTQEGDVPVYVIAARRGARVFRVRVHAVHGRLLSIEQLASERWQRVYQWPGVRVVAHRGGALLGPPENTLPAIERAIEVGADLIEIDLRQTSDGHLVLMHDVTVDRTTNGSGRVDQMTLAEIKRLEILHDGRETVRVPTLEEALLAMKGRIDPDLDFKEGDPKPLLDVVKKLELTEHSTMHGAWERLAGIAEIEPRIRIRPTADFPQQVPALIRQLRPALVNLDWHAVTEEAVRLAHLGGCHAFVNCLSLADTEPYMRRAAVIGADYIQSDQPDKVIDILKELGLRESRPPLGDPLGTPLRSPDLTYPLR